MNIYRIAFVIFFSLSLSVNAQDPENNSSPGSSHELVLGLGQINFDDETATREAIKNSAPYIRMGWEGDFNGFLAGAGLSGYFYSDDADFEQQVVDQFGNQSTAESSASAFSLTAEAGYRYQFNQSATFDILGGYEQVVSSKRSIDNCDNCFSDDIDLDSGLFITPRFRYIFGKKFPVSLSYQHYLSGDTVNAIVLTGGIIFGSRDL